MPEAPSSHVVKLIRHPTSPGLGVMAIEAEIATTPEGGMALRYTLQGATAGLRVPPFQADAPPRREDGLWRHTCMEIFVRTAGGAAYREFNFSPAGAWQAYAFSTYREGGAQQTDACPRLSRPVTDTPWQLEVEVPASLLPLGPWQLAVSAVLESRDGRIGYWALRHPKPTPDFHHADAFALELTPS